jgi:pimeloyl-ACP methyl ester carboxylesterase
VAGMATHEIETSAGPLRYREVGAGPPILFVHGLLVDGALWDPVAERLASDFRCILPDWPLGSHRLAMHADADLSPLGLARLVDEVIGTLALEGVTIVGNDTGGAICQLVAARHPDGLGAVVLTPCDAYENFPPRIFAPVMLAPSLPGGLAISARIIRSRRLRRLPFAFGRLSKRGVPQALAEQWSEGIRSDAAIRRDCAKAIRSLDRGLLIETAEVLRRFDRPVLLVWASEDRAFPLRYGERLLSDLPRARLEVIDDSYTFVSLDQPERTAQLIREFVRAEVYP